MLDEHEIELYAITLSHSTSAIKNKNLHRDTSIFFLKVIFATLHSGQVVHPSSKRGGTLIMYDMLASNHDILIPNVAFTTTYTTIGHTHMGPRPTHQLYFKFVFKNHSLN